MSQRHADIWSHPGHYLVDLYTLPFKVMAKVKPDGHIWSLKLNQYVWLSFHGNETILAEI